VVYLFVVRSALQGVIIEVVFPGISEKWGYGQEEEGSWWWSWGEHGEAVRKRAAIYNSTHIEKRSHFGSHGMQAGA